jgi:hypothetical protein
MQRRYQPLAESKWRSISGVVPCLFEYGLFNQPVMWTSRGRRDVVGMDERGVVTKIVDKCQYTVTTVGGGRHRLRIERPTLTG